MWFNITGTPIVCEVCLCVISYIAFTCTLTVVEESAKAAAVQVIQDYHQETFIKLKRCWELQMWEGDKS